MAIRPDQKIGYLTLGVGILALVVVGFMAMVRYGVGPQAMQGIGMTSALNSEWQSDFNGFHAIFQTHDNTFQILAVRRVQEETRYYSRGTYTLNGTRLTLVPVDSMGEPESGNPDVKYQHLTYGTYTIELQHQGRNLVWHSGPVDPEHSTVNPTHPLIQYSGKDFIVWSPKT